MSREIKFRARLLLEHDGMSDTAGKWLYGYIVRESTQTLIYWQEGNVIRCERVINETVGECTGLKDKNGQEIYEGDILEGDATSMDYPLKAKVYWDAEYGMWKADQYDYNEVCEFELWSFLEEYQYISIIGNIHENPELLTNGR